MEQPHSTLEVNPHQFRPDGSHGSYQSQFPEVVPGEQLKYPEVSPSETAFVSPTDTGKEAYEPAAFAPEVYTPQYDAQQYGAQHYDAQQYGAHDGAQWQNSGFPQYPQQTDAAQQAGMAADGTPPANTSICGLARRTFFIVVGVVLAVVIAIAVGVPVGVLKSRDNAAAEPASATSTAGGSSGGSGTGSGNGTTTTLSILSNSSLTATNFTDTSGYNHRFVFFQDSYNSLIVRRWDSQNTTWATTNISAVMSNSNTPIDIPSGTALATTGFAHQVELFLIDSIGMIRSLYCSDVLSTPDLWQNVTMNDTLYTYPGSQLAATAQGCGANDSCLCDLFYCTSGWLIVYQQADTGAVISSNYTSSWSSRQEAVGSNGVTAGTSMAIIPQYGGDMGAMGLVTQSYISSTAGSLEVTTYTDDHVWDESTPTTVMANLTEPGSSSHFAVTPWTNWAITLMYAIADDGVLRGSWWKNGTTTTLSSITLDGAPSNVTTFANIAMTDDAMFYGISDDQLVEFTVDDDNASILHYSATIFP